MKKVIVLGAGMVGSAMALDLAKKYNVGAADYDVKALSNLMQNNITIFNIDLSSTESVKEVVKNYDLVIGAVPGHLGYQTCKAVLEAGKNIVDISFFPEDLFGLDELAKENNLSCIVDCGVAPGMGNLILGYHNEKMGISNFECYVGGLPQKREKPFEYKAPFSPIDVLEEYTRPARYVENGHVITKPALSDPEYMTFDEVGTLEAFNTDGLRSLLKTMDIPNMKEKTLRYPGHIEYIKVLKDSGFFSHDPVSVNNRSIKPIDFTSKILFDKWKLHKGEPEFTIMRIIIEGKEKSKHVRYVYDLYDKCDPKTKTSSMARTTGYTATAVANLFLDEGFELKGIIPPEYISKNEDHFHYILKYLEERGVVYRKTVY